MPEQLKLTFHPSFHPSLDFTLKMDKDSGVVSYRVFDPKNPLMCAPFTAGFDALTLTVGGAAYLNFAETISAINFKDYKGQPKEGIVLDGIKISVQHISGSIDSGMLDFESYNRERCPIEYKLLDGFFEFAEKILEEKKRLEYIRDLKSYFDYASTSLH